MEELTNKNENSQTFSSELFTESGWVVMMIEGDT